MAPDTLTPEELDAFVLLPEDTGYEEPDCWGFNSYEHYKGQCKHHEREYHEEAARDD